MCGIEHHTIADVAINTAAHNARRHEIELVNTLRRTLANDQGMTCIVTTLKAHYALGVVGEPIDDFAFAFIAPLRADNNYVFCYFIHKF